MWRTCPHELHLGAFSNILPADHHHWRVRGDVGVWVVFGQFFLQSVKRGVFSVAFELPRWDEPCRHCGVQPGGGRGDLFSIIIYQFQWIARFGIVSWIQPDSELFPACLDFFGEPRVKWDLYHRFTIAPSFKSDSLISSISTASSPWMQCSWGGTWNAPAVVLFVPISFPHLGHL
jgi:hypothetical protein